MTPGFTHSCLFECRVLHERLAPKHHRFVYRLFYFAVDLDELSSLSRNFKLFSVNRGNLFSFREDDYLPLDERLHNPSAAEPSIISKTATLKERVRHFCARQNADPGADGRVLLVTLPRVLGYLFNPVSFYFCFNRNGEPVGAIAEVTNTFKETKPYFIPASSSRGVFQRRDKKNFYVSPFSSLDLEFDFRLQVPGQTLAVRIDDFEDARRILHTTLTGSRTFLSDARLLAFLFKYPLVTLRVITLIHWQALLLWLKRVPYFAKAAGAENQRDLYRPHPSIHKSPASP